VGLRVGLDSVVKNKGDEKFCVILVGKPEGKRPLGRLKHRREVIIRIDLRQNETVWIGFIWLRIGTSGGLL
jgi:hypothetical protein